MRAMAGEADARSDFATIAAIAVVGALLYFARDFLIPVALAALLVFLLNPLVKRLERSGVPRFAGVALVAVAILSAGALAAWFIAGEGTDLVRQLPDFKATLLQKPRTPRRPVRPLSDAPGLIDLLRTEI